MMDKAVYKRYMNLTNIVLRLSDGTAAGKADAILVNSHLVGLHLFSRRVELKI